MNRYFHSHFIGESSEAQRKESIFVFIHSVSFPQNAIFNEVCVGQFSVRMELATSVHPGSTVT